MPAYKVGDKVRILEKLVFGHYRVPIYARGQVGVIERVLPDFLIPEDAAFGRPQGRKETLKREISSLTFKTVSGLRVGSHFVTSEL